MALGRCRKCGKIASTEAKTCPHCRAKNPVRKGSAKGAKLIAAVFVTGVLAAGAAVSLGPGPSSVYGEGENFSRPVPVAAVDPAEQSAQKYRSTMTSTIATSLKNSIARPDSLIWESILANDSASVVCLVYRVKNDADDYNLGYMSYIDGKVSETSEEWNRHCVGKKLNNMIHLKDTM